jgi:hypothetical protein
MALVLIIFGAFLWWLSKRLTGWARGREEKKAEELYRKQLLAAAILDIRDAVMEEPVDRIEELIRDTRELEERQVLIDEINQITMEVGHGQDPAGLLGKR